MYYRDYREIYEWAFTAKIYPNKKEVGELYTYIICSGKTKRM